MGAQAPAAPDYTGAAEAAGQSSVANTQQQTFGNRVNQYTPFGAQEWQSYDTGQKDAQGNPLMGWNQFTTLDPAAQGALDDQMYLQNQRSDLGSNMFGRVTEELGNPMNWGAMPNAGGEVGSRSQQLQYGLPTRDLKTNLDFSGAPAMGQNPNFQTQIGGGDPYYDKAGDAYYQQATSRLDPQWQQQEERMRTQLANQGLAAGDASYDQQMQNFQRGRNDAYGSAMNQATMLAGQEAQRMQGMDVTGAQFGNTWNQQGFQNQNALRGIGTQEIGQQASFYNQAQQQGFGQDQNAAAFGNQAQQQGFGQDLSASQYETQRRQSAIAEEMQARGWSLNELNALLSGQQVGMPSMPGYNQATKADTTNYLGAAQQQGQYGLDAAAQQNSFLGDMMGGIGSLGSAAAMFSDERLKKNVKRLPFSVAPGVPLAEYEWKGKKGGRELGVIAQDVEQANPQAVTTDPATGYKKVNYEAVAPGLPFSLGGKSRKGGRRG